MYMKYLIPCFILMFSSCIELVLPTTEPCPYETQYPGHWLKVPITVTPHQQVYNIGDTITFSTHFSNQIYDIGTQETFEINNFPFKPLTALYRFQNSLEWDAGYRVNELIVDSIYNPDYNHSSNYADSFKARTLFEEDEYHFDFKLVLTEPGKYIFLQSDIYQEHVGGGLAHLNTEADSITFEGQCERLSYAVCNVIEGETHLDDYEREMVHLDTAVFRKNLRSKVDGSLGPLGPGSIYVEFTGFFGFEVQE